jgi:predicted nucleic acid-binding protein
MSGKFFIDSNILVYGQDSRHPEKQRVAQALAAQLVETGNGVVSTQVLQEFYVAVTEKLGVAPLAAKAVLKTFSAFEIVQVTPELVQEAVDCSILSQLSFWDALVIVAADAAGCTTLYSEDLNPGQVVLGVKVLNPFAAASKRPKA